MDTFNSICHLRNSVNAPAVFRVPGVRSIMCLLALLLCVPRPAAGQQSMDFATGADFARRLRQPVQISWSQSPLRPSLERLAQTQRVAVFLDRRLDPQRPLDLHLPLTPLAESLEQIARHQDAAVSWLDPVVYLGPPATTAKLATLLELNRQQLQQVPESTRRGWETPAPTSWALLSQPRQLVQQMAGQRGVTLEGIDRIPHDLWAAQQLPPLDLLQQLTIVLAGFDLCVVLDANGQARVASIPQRVAVTRSYTLTDRQWSRWPQWSATLAGIESQRVGRELVLAARAEDHRRVSDWLQGSKPARRTDAAPGGQKRYTLNVQNQPRDRLLESLARQLDLQLRWQSVGDQQMSQLVSLKVQDATLDQLLRTAVGESGLTYRLDGTTLIISGPQPEPE